MEEENVLKFYDVDNSNSIEKLRLIRKEIKAKDKKIKREKQELRRLLKQTYEIDARLKRQEKIIRAKYQESRSKRKQEKKVIKQTRFQRKYQILPMTKGTRNLGIEVKSAFEQNISEVKYTNKTNTDNQDILEQDITRDLQSRIQYAITRFGEVRVQFGIGMVLRNQDGETINWYHTNSHVRVTATTNIAFLVR